MKFRSREKHDVYLEMQAGIAPLKQEYAEWRADRDYKTFKLKFRRFSDFIAVDAKILCLGARLGTEVRAMRGLGHANVIGTDIGDYEGNDGLVIYGDFMRLPEQFAENSIDFAYTNCFDHTSNPFDFLKGLMTVLKPGGYALIDAYIGPEKDWSSYWHWYPESADDLTAIMMSSSSVIGWVEIKKPFNGRSYLLKKGDVLNSDIDLFKNSVADMPHGIGRDFDVKLS